MEAQAATKAKAMARMEVYLAYLDYKVTTAEMLREENSFAADEVRNSIRDIENLLETHGLFQRPKPIVESLKSMFDELIGPNRKRPKVQPQIAQNSAPYMDSEKKSSAKFESPALDSRNNKTFQTFRGTSATKNKENQPPSKMNSQAAQSETSERSKYSSSGSAKMPQLVAATDLPHKRHELLADGLVPTKPAPAIKPPSVSQADIFKMLGLSSPGDGQDLHVLKPQNSGSQMTSGKKEGHESGKSNASRNHTELSNFVDTITPFRELPPTPGESLFKQSLSKAAPSLQTADYSERVEALMSLLLAP